jgi:hypothetical protein
MFLLDVINVIQLDRWFETSGGGCKGSGDEEVAGHEDVA